MKMTKNWQEYFDIPLNDKEDILNVMNKNSNVGKRDTHPIERKCKIITNRHIIMEHQIQPYVFIVCTDEDDVTHIPDCTCLRILSRNSGQAHIRN